MRLTLNDRYIKGTVAFEELSPTRARMSYIYDSANPPLPAGAKYTINDKNWRIITAAKSEYNPQVMNLELERDE